MQAKSRAWQPGAAYLYVLGLDPASLAWEFLRRNPAYRHDWSVERSDAGAAASRWGLMAFEDPARDAERAHPAWWPVPKSAVQVQRAAVETHAAYRLGIWQLEGRKVLAHAGRCVQLTLDVHPARYRLRLPLDWVDGAPIAYVVEANADTAECWSAIQRVNAVFGGTRRPRPAGCATTVTRKALTHMRALHALDGSLAGASHRDIAIALFGAKRVAEGWSSDGELRAQTRYCIRGARHLMEGGYRKLVWPAGRAPPGA